MIRQMADRFQELRPEVRLDVRLGGSGTGINDVTAGKADIGMASRPLKGAEVALYSFAIARDGVCLIVHKGNPIRSLTRQQMIGIYTRKITNWREVGGHDAPIVVMAVREGFSSTELFLLFLNIAYTDIRADSVLGENATRITAISATPNGVTYVSVGEAERTAAMGAPIKLLAIDGLAASRRTVGNGNFPISRPLLLLTRERPKGVVKDFIDFAMSPAVADIVDGHDFVPYQE